MDFSEEVKVQRKKPLKQKGIRYLGKLWANWLKLRFVLPTLSDT